MLLKTRSNEHLIEVANLIDLMNLNVSQVIGRSQEGEEQQDPQSFNKADLVFLSGEDLPRCWTDPHYRDSETR
jgi:hypothetical protein